MRNPPRPKIIADAGQLRIQQEYFAELSEAWLGTNDYYPFVRCEVVDHDPEAGELLRKIWEGRGEIAVGEKGKGEKGEGDESLGLKDEG